MSYQPPTIDDHLPPWTQGDTTDTRGQMFRNLKFDQGLTPAAGMPIIFKNPGYVFGQVPAAGIADGSITSAKILDGTIMNVDVNVAAAIAYAKLNLANSIVNADIAAGAAIAYAKLNLANSIVTGDIVNGTIVDADVNAAAALTWSKFAANGGRVHGTTQVIATATTTTVVWATQTFQNAAYVTNGTGGLAATLTGTYLITYGVLFPGPAAPVGGRSVAVLVAGTGVSSVAVAAHPAANAASALSGATVQRLTAADAITMQIAHTQGANLTFANDVRTYLAAFYLSP